VSKNAAAASAATASAVSGSGNGTFSAAALTGVNSVTAASATALTLAGGSTSGQILFNSPSATERARLTSTGNLLIGTTTDITGTGGLHVAGTSTASTTTSGALRVGSNVGLSGNAGGASYFGGQVSSAGGGTAGTLPFTSANATLGGYEVFSASASLDQKRWQWQAGTAVGDGTIRLRAINDATTNGSNAISITRTAEVVGTITLGTATALVNIPGTTSASSSTVGALTIGNGTAATNVAIGGGNVNAGGTGTFGGAVSIAGTVIHTLSATPASATAAGTVGTMSWDANYIYICTATNTWKRVAIATW
jgi:hypothetical protein